jgi:hypothetical protein
MCIYVCVLCCVLFFRFDRSGGVRHSEFDTLCEQEGEYLDIIAAKILAAGPTLVPLRGHFFFLSSLYISRDTRGGGGGGRL